MEKVTVTSVAVVTKQFLFGMCDCIVDIDVGKNNFSFVLGIWHICGHGHV